MTTLILYITDACHLCEQAKSVVYPIIDSSADIKLVEVDIVDDLSLMNLYGVRIPVLKNADTGLECDWPFDSEQITKIIGE